MNRIYYLQSIFIIAIIFTPTLLWSTRGPKDYGILMVVMFMIYSIPIGILLLCFLIYAIGKLRSIKKPKKGQGKIIFIISIVIIFLSILIPLAIMSGEDWEPEVIKLMLGTFMPILVLALITIVLAKLVKNRSLQGEDKPE